MDTGFIKEALLKIVDQEIAAYKRDLRALSELEELEVKIAKLKQEVKALDQIQKTAQEWKYRLLVQERTTIPGTIQEVARFSTWWSNNLATVINQQLNYYQVFLLVYEPQYKNSLENLQVFPTSPTSSYWGEHKREQHSLLAEAQKEASWLRKKLDGENPILLIHPYCDCSRAFEVFIKEPYVVKEYLPLAVNPTEHFKSLDIKLRFWLFML